MKVKGYLLGCISAATYGLIPLFALPTLEKGMGYESILFYRFMFASLMIASVMLLRKEKFSVSKKEVVPLLALGIIFSLSAQCLFTSYQYLASGVAATILFLYPIIVAVMMWMFFKEKLSLIAVLSIILAFTGVIILYQGEDGISLNLIGVVLVLCSALFYALYIVTVNKSRVNTMSGYKLTFYALSVCALFFLSKSLIIKGQLDNFPDVMSGVDLILLALIPTVISNITMVYSVHHIGSTSTAILGAMEPITAVCVGVFVFKDPFTSNLAVGILLIIIAVSLIILSEPLTRILKQQFMHHEKTKK